MAPRAAEGCLSCLHRRTRTSVPLRTSQFVFSMVYMPILGNRRAHVAHVLPARRAWRRRCRRCLTNRGTASESPIRSCRRAPGRHTRRRRRCRRRDAERLAMKAATCGGLLQHDGETAGPSSARGIDKRRALTACGLAVYTRPGVSPTGSQSDVTDDRNRGIDDRFRTPEHGPAPSLHRVGPPSGSEWRSAATSSDG